MLESHKKRCVMNPGSMPPALREHTTALLNKWRKEAETANITASKFTGPMPLPATTSVSSPTGSQTSASVVLGITESVPSDDLNALPPTPPPNLLFRLYQNSDNGSRELLCNFLESSSLGVAPSPKRRRGARRGTANRWILAWNVCPGKGTTQSDTGACRGPALNYFMHCLEYAGWDRVLVCSETFHCLSGSIHFQFILILDLI